MNFERKTDVLLCEQKEQEVLHPFLKVQIKYRDEVMI